MGWALGPILKGQAYWGYIWVPIVSPNMANIANMSILGKRMNYVYLSGRYFWVIKIPSNLLHLVLSSNF